MTLLYSNPSPRVCAPLLLSLCAALSACSGDVLTGEFATAGASGSESLGGDGDGDGDGSTPPETETQTETDDWGEEDPTEEWGEEETEEPPPEPLGPMDCDELDCGPGSCVQIDELAYCECPEDSSWYAYTCEPCPVLDNIADHEVSVSVLQLVGRITVNDQPPPTVSFDYGSVWLENTVTGDRVSLGDTRTPDFSVRVTPGIYDLVYEAEQAGAIMPSNPHVVVRKLALFESQVEVNFDIPVVAISGAITVDGATPPEVSFDDADLMLRDPSGHELLAGESDEGAYVVHVVPSTYEFVYRVDTVGAVMPANDGAVLDLVEIVDDEAGSNVFDVDIPTTTLSGEFLVNGAPAPGVAFDDANIALESPTAGAVALGKTSDGTFEVNLIDSDDYELVYMHESGTVMPQNRHARLGALDLLEPEVSIDIPSVTLAGDITLNGEAPPPNQFDDGLVYLLSEGGDGDRVPLANTHDGAYQVAVIPGAYTAHYSVETAGGTMPENTRARIGEPFEVASDTVHEVPILAVPLAGAITLGGDAPPASVYEDGRVFLRSVEGEGEDSVMLGNTHEGSYAAMVVPGSYELFYVQEAGGAVPNNQNAFIGAVDIVGGMAADIDIPAVELSGVFSRSGDEGQSPAPQQNADGGQIYLRSARGDVALLGESYSSTFTAKLVSGTYGLYYRAEGSETMPSNQNGRFACIELGQ